MNKKIAKLLAFTVLAVGVAQAREMRSPYLGEKGPIRYTFEKENPDRYSLSIYSEIYGKEAHRAFMKHGTDSKPLSTLFFNKEVIDTVGIFPTLNNDDKYYLYENYNPYVILGGITPKVTYYEWGYNFGGRFEYPVYKDKGRIGLRANIPLRTIEIERENFFDKNENPLDDYRINKVVELKYNDGAADKNVVVNARSYRMDLINQMYYIEGSGAFGPGVSKGDKSFKIFGNEIAKKNQNKIAASNLKAGIISHDNVNTKPEHKPQTGPFLAFGSKDSVNMTADKGPTKYVNPDGSFGNLSPGGWDAAKEIAFFTGKENGDDALNYANLSLTDDWLKTKWLVLGYDENGDPDGTAGQILKGADNWIRQFDDNPYAWFARRNFFFEPDRRQGFGDIDLDLFYEHTFSDEWVAEFMLGVRFPTGPSDDYTGNPLKAHTGNGEHWEIKLGAMGAWMPLDWMNVKLDGQFAFVLEATEKRCAGFKGAQIKNIGPAVDADVDWQYFTIRLDFNFFHPKTDDLSTDIGYELYYKIRDDITQKKTKMESWLGRKWHNLGNEANPNYGWQITEFDLDNGVLENNTQRISHKIRGESSYRFSDWFEMYAGGSYVFAGKNIPRETDIHAGVNVRF